MQDLTGVPAVVDLAVDARRDHRARRRPRQDQPAGARRAGHRPLGDPRAHRHARELRRRTSPSSTSATSSATPSSSGPRARFEQFRVVPPGMGICHQVNLEHLARVVFEHDGVAYLDTVVGTDSHTTMVNGLGVLGWGVGGIEAEAGMLGQPTSMLIPPVVGLRLSGATREGVTATDVVLTITELLRTPRRRRQVRRGLRPGRRRRSRSRRAPRSATCRPSTARPARIFPIDQVTLDYLAFTGRPAGAARARRGLRQGPGHLARRRRARADLLRVRRTRPRRRVEPSLAGPKRPQDRVSLSGARGAFRDALGREPKEVRAIERRRAPARRRRRRRGDHVVHQHLEPLGARRRGPRRQGARSSADSRAKPWVKTSLAPGSRVVMDYLERADLVDAARRAGLLPRRLRLHDVHRQHRAAARRASPTRVNEHDLSVVSVLSGNRNFEGRIHPDVQAELPRVAAARRRLRPRRHHRHRPRRPSRSASAATAQPVFLADLWPSDAEVADAVRASITPEMFEERYASAFSGDERWQARARRPTPSPTPGTPTSTYVKLPAVLRRTHHGARRRSATSPARACSPSSATR